jgi:DNA (cytosine-5)-methyltransferase 1
LLKESVDKDTKLSTRRLSFADLFSGPGGLSLGFKMSGFFEPVVAVELNSRAAETYRTNLGVDVLERKVGEVDPAELLQKASEKGYDSIDAVIGGPPCRPFTTANKGGTRWEKIKENNKGNKGCDEHPDWLSFWRIIEALNPQPRIVVAENVMGFKSHDDVFSKFLVRLKQHYMTCFRELHAHCFGIPQNRKRIFIAGIKDFDENPELILPINPQPESVETVAVKDAISDLPELSNSSPGTPISTYGKGRPTRYESSLREECKILYDHITHSVHPAMAERFTHIPPGYSLSKAWAEKVVPRTSMHSHYFVGNIKKEFSKSTLENMHSNIYRRLGWKEASCTITHVRKAVLIHPLQDRLISVREAARLQSFPDWFRFSGSTSQQYQQVADAVPPLLAQAIADHIGRLLASNSLLADKKYMTIRHTLILRPRKYLPNANC